MGERAFELIDEKRDTETLISQLNNTGTMALLLGRPEGREHLERSIALAEEARLEHHVGRGYIHLAWAASRRRDFALIERLAGRNRLLHRARARAVAALPDRLPGTGPTSIRDGGRRPPRRHPTSFISRTATRS